MLWLGVRGRRKIGALEERMEQLEERFRLLDVEVTDHIDRLSGIARRFTGRKGGRPPNKPDADADGEAESPPASSFTRHVL